MVNARLEELNLDKDELVVEALEFAQKRIDQGQGIVVGGFAHEEGDETRLEILAQEGAPLADGPFYAGACGRDLNVSGVGYGGKEVEKLAD